MSSKKAEKIPPTLLNIANPDNNFLNAPAAQKLINGKVAAYKLLALFFQQVMEGRGLTPPPMERTRHEIILETPGGWVAGKKM